MSYSYMKYLKTTTERALNSNLVRKAFCSSH